jgi:hypothetical protein
MKLLENVAIKNDICQEIDVLQIDLNVDEMIIKIIILQINLNIQISFNEDRNEKVNKKAIDEICDNDFRIFC